jgi:peptide/nickel transport system substrate-binding protein
MDRRPESDDATSSSAGQLSRRSFLKGGVAAGIGAAAIAAGVPAGVAGATTAAPGLAVVKPKRGGTITAGITGGTTADTLNAENNITPTDNIRNCLLYEPLASYDQNALVELILAEELEPNADATAWTIRVKPGVTFHNGKALSAADVLFSLRYITNPKAPYQGSSMISPLDLANAKILDARTVRIPCFRPFSILPDVFADTITSIIPEGYNPAKPVGTGAFKYKSFTPGVQSVCTAYENYWRTGLPYVDEVVVIDVASETAQVNGLLSGQFDLVNTLSASSISPIASSGNQILISNGGGWTPFTMRVDVAPFSDVRVRQAFRNVVNRPQMLDAVFSGHGTLGNDLFSIWDPAYDHALPQREQDIEEAKFLLKKAGKENLQVELVTADIAQGTVLAAQVLAQQASAAGITVHLRTLTPTEFFGPNYLKWTFAQDYWYYFGYLSQVTQATLPKAFYNECHFDDPRYNSLYYQCCAITDPVKRIPLEQEMQVIDYNTNGYIIPYFPPVIGGYSKNLNGVTGSKNGSSFNNWDIKQMWIG